MTDAEAEQSLRQLVRDQLLAEAARRTVLRAAEELRAELMMRRIYDNIERNNRSAHGTAKL